MWTPEAAQERIVSGALLPPAMFKALNSGALLDARDHSFDGEWICAAEDVRAAWEESPSLSCYTQAIDAVREAAFKRTFAASGGIHDLSAAVSDDFEILCKRALLGIDSPFITRLERAYDSHQIPH